VARACLLGGPLTLRFKEEIPASGQKLFGGISIFTQPGAIGVPLLVSVFDLLLLILAGFSSHPTANVLDSFGDEALDVEAEDERGAWERLCDHRLHRL